MAKRRTKEQIDADKIIKAKLNELGQKVYEEATENSRVAKDLYYLTDRVGTKGTLRKAGGTLRDSVNYMVKPDTVLTVAQVYYGKFQDPNELQMAINRNIDDTTNIIVEEIIDLITRDYDS